MDVREQVVVIGASGFGRESLDVLEAMEEKGATLQVLGVVDDAPSVENLARLSARGIKYLGTIDEWLTTASSITQFVLGIGNPAVRRRLAERLESRGFFPFPAVHPQAIIGGSTVLGPGVVVCAGAVISTNVRFGHYVHINPNATIGHDVVLDDYVSVNPAAVISGEVKIYKEVLVGAGALILQDLSVGQRTIVGASSLVTRNVPADVIVKGVPGRWD